MAISESPAPVEPRSPAERPRRWGHAFGLDVRASFEIPGLGSPHDDPRARETVCSNEAALELDRAWPGEESERAVDLRFPDGRLFMGISRHPELGYRIWAPQHGRHVVSPDGRRIRSALPRRSSLGWPRLFFAQALPLAAALQGLEVLHASAVEVDGRAIAFTAASGTGKSSLAAHLVAAGASFLTDDVLALEESDRGVLAHPGPARAGVPAAELRSMTPPERKRLGRRVGATDKPHVEPRPAASAVPLRILYRLSRGGSGGEPLVCEQIPPEPRDILASSFLSYLRTRERLLNQLEICDRVASSVRLFQVEIPSGVEARAAAMILLAHAETVLAR